MKKLFAMMVSMALIVTVAASPVWAVGDKVRSDKAAGPAGETGDGDGQASRGTPVGESAQLLSVQEDMTGKKNPSGATASLSEKEKEALLFVREEEKLARDVYLALGEKWELAVFSNIAESEQQHMDKVLYLLGKYGLQDPAENKQIGEFTNQDLQTLYNELLAQGIQSVTEALRAGVIIEETDIADLEDHLELTDNNDIIQVFTNLLNGSENHLAAFNSHLGY
ncbi:MAG: DUF2202 domain-containing protein [Desulfobacterales bacterium]